MVQPFILVHTGIIRRTVIVVSDTVVQDSDSIEFLLTSKKRNFDAGQRCLTDRHRKTGTLGCNFTRRKDIPLAIRIIEEIKVSLGELKQQMRGKRIGWRTNDGLPRAGYNLHTALSPLAGNGQSNDYKEAVLWMRDHLGHLACTFYPILQRRIDANN